MQMGNTARSFLDRWACAAGARSAAAATNWSRWAKVP
jgi:hypothetical protein